MIIKGSGRSALILAAGLFVCFAGPSLAAAAANDATATSKSENAAAAAIKLHKNLRYGAHHRKSYAHRRSHKVALKPAEGKKAVAIDVADNGEALPTVIPPSVANANAQLALPGMPGGTAGAMAARANDLLQAGSDNPADAKADNKADNQTLLVAADQLNDVDRSLREGNSTAANAAVASANPPAAPVLASSQESSTWDETSLIGKIFIGFGALLTMASAVRMFIA
ncbi:hypothetical protein [Bradyrhizobium sp.]|uniref:hypothetical protein n=1 Tax=Bradyrhizobium sp. TaxID=376 RepID=UPI003C752AD2